MSSLCGSLPPPCYPAYIQDLSGNQHPGSPTAVVVPGRYGGALQFSGQSDWITAIDGWSTALAPSTITVSVWIRTSSTLNQWAVSKWISGSNGNSHYLLTAQDT